MSLKQQKTTGFHYLLANVSESQINSLLGDINKKDVVGIRYATDGTLSNKAFLLLDRISSTECYITSSISGRCAGFAAIAALLSDEINIENDATLVLSTTLHHFEAVSEVSNFRCKRIFNFIEENLSPILTSEELISLENGGKVELTKLDVETRLDSLLNNAANEQLKLA